MPQKPWEKYQTAEANEGPWTKYQSADFSNVESGSSSSTDKQPSWMDVRYAGQPSLNDIVGVGKGAAKAAGDFVQTGGQWLESILGMPVSAPRMTATGRDVFQPNNQQEAIGKIIGQLGMGVAAGGAGGPTLAGQVAAGGLGGALLSPDAPTGAAVAGMAAPVAAKGISALANAAKTKAAGEKFGLLEGALKDAAPDYSKATAATEKAKKLKATGGGPIPESIKSWMKRGEPVKVATGSKNLPLYQNPEPVLYPEGRQFAMNAGSSVAEGRKMKDPMKAALTEFSVALKEANRDAAVKIGMGDVYDQAMKEYRNAKTLQEAAEVLTKWGRRAAIAAFLGASGKAGFDLYDTVK